MLQPPLSQVFGHIYCGGEYVPGKIIYISTECEQARCFSLTYARSAKLMPPRKHRNQSPERRRGAHLRVCRFRASLQSIDSLAMPGKANNDIWQLPRKVSGGSMLSTPPGLRPACPSHCLRSGFSSLTDSSTCSHCFVRSDLTPITKATDSAKYKRSVPAGVGKLGKKGNSTTTSSCPETAPFWKRRLTAPLSFCRN